MLGLFLFGSIASAHVTVAPKTSTTGEWETYTLKVPVEKEAATTKITVKVPAGFEIESYQPIPGWNYTAEKDANNKVKIFTFEATGQGILPGQFQQFVFVAKNPDKATDAPWDAYQYYKDGSVVEWTGNKSAKSPHAITNIVTAEPSTSDQKDSHAAVQNNNDDGTKSDATSSAPLMISIITL